MDYYKALSKSGKKPQSILKIVIGFSVALLAMWLFLVSKMDTSTISQSKEPEMQERTMGLQESLRSTKLEDEKTTETAGTEKVAKKEAPDLFQNAFITFLIMVAMLGGIWLWMKKKGGGNGKPTPKSRELDVHRLGENSQLKFLEINEEIWVIGMSENGINLLHRYPREEWKESLMDELSDVPNVAEKTGSKGDFKSFLKLVSS